MYIKCIQFTMNSSCVYLRIITGDTTHRTVLFWFCTMWLQCWLCDYIHIRCSVETEALSVLSVAYSERYFKKGYSSIPNVHVNTFKHCMQEWIIYKTHRSSNTHRDYTVY